VLFNSRKEIGSVAADSTNPQTEEQDARDFFMGDEVVRCVLRSSGIFLLIVVVLVSAVWANLAFLAQVQDTCQKWSQAAPSWNLTPVQKGSPFWTTSIGPLSHWKHAYL
jgi:hypothetical protein